MIIRILPLIAGLVPIIGANLAFWIGVQADVLPSCIPYIDGCTSISATGRNPPGSYLFRAVHFPYAVLLAFVWYFSFEWLRLIEGPEHRVRRRIVYASGLTGSVALIVYITFLGSNVPIMEFMRRGGIYFYFLGTSLAQLMTTVALLGVPRSQSSKLNRTLIIWMLIVCLAPFALGVFNLVQKSILPYEISDLIENQVEWIAAFLMQAWFVLLYVAWRRTGFNILVGVR